MRWPMTCLADHPPSSFGSPARASLMARRRPSAASTVLRNSAPNSRIRLTRILTGDIAVQLPDRVGLSGDDRIHHVANRNHADQAVAIEDGKVADAVVRNEVHAFRHRAFRSHGYGRASHDLV